MGQKKKLPIGIEFFKDIQDRDYYYVDKTGFIQQLLDFTNDEVKQMLCYYGLENKLTQMKEWYDGYRFGQTDIYCPWDILNQCDKFLESENAPMEPHWANSSSNAIIQDILENATDTTKNQIEALISGECIEKRINSRINLYRFRQ